MWGFDHRLLDCEFITLTTGSYFTDLMEKVYSYSVWFLALLLGGCEVGILLPVSSEEILHVYVIELMQSA